MAWDSRFDSIHFLLKSSASKSWTGEALVDPEIIFSKNVLSFGRKLLCMSLINFYVVP